MFVKNDGSKNLAEQSGLTHSLTYSVLTTAGMNGAIECQLSRVRLWILQFQLFFFVNFTDMSRNRMA